MRPVTRFIVYTFLLFLLFLVSLRPYNWICQTTNACHKFYLSDLIPRFEGEDIININFEIINTRDDVDFIIDGYDTISTVSERKNTVSYRVKNLSDKIIYFRPKLGLANWGRTRIV